MPRISLSLRVLVYYIGGLAALIGAMYLIVTAWAMLRGAYAGDAAYYWTVGRGLLNGLDLYRDIYETKPPGIFLLSVASLWMFDNGTLGFILNALIVPAVPALFGLVAYRMGKDRMAILLSVLFGTVMVLYMALHAEGWQTEWYGAFFGILYVVILVTGLLRCRVSTFLSYYVMGLLSMCMFFAIGFKEPFALSLIAAGLILLPDARSFARGLLIPLLIVAVAGVAALLLFGFFDSYVSVYLPSQFGNLVRSAPLWQRGFWLDVFVEYLWRFSYAFPFLVAFLFGSAFLESRSITRKIIIVVVLFLVSLAANLRGYPALNHFVVAVPAYTALFFLLLRSGRSDSLRLIALVALTSLTLVLLPLRNAFPSRTDDSSAREAAERIDAVLDACGVDRYFAVEKKPYMPFTKHSPLNYFVYIGAVGVVYRHPIIVERQLTGLSEAQIVIAEGNAYEISTREEEKLISQLVFRYLANHFTIVPRSCAIGLPVPEGYSVLFRTDPEDKTPFPFRINNEE